MSDSSNRLSIAYFVNQYPKVSHSFIRREILALERQEVSIQRLALRGWDAELVDREDLEEQQKTEYVLKGGVAQLLRAALTQLLFAPGRFFTAARLALKMGTRADRPWPLHLIYLAEACRIVPWLKRSRVQHMHAHFGTNSTEVVMLAGALTGLPYSFTVHGPEEFDKPEFIGLGEKIRRASFVVAITSFCRSQLFRWVAHTEWPKMQIVHCGLESAFHDVPDQGVPLTPRLVCVGRLCEQKGQLLLLHAAARIHQAGVPLELVLAGDGEMRPEIEALISTLGIQSIVRITGWISSGQVREEIVQSRALVLPSFAEGLPVVIMEAMALRRPVITTYIAGIPELVTHGESGWLVPAGAVENLTLAMLECLNASPERLVTMGAAARQRVLAQHDVDHEATRLRAMFAASALKQASPVFSDR